MKIHPVHTCPTCGSHFIMQQTDQQKADAQALADVRTLEVQGQRGGVSASKSRRRRQGRRRPLG
jgi:hypothetical protein